MKRVLTSIGTLLLSSHLMAAYIQCPSLMLNKAQILKGGGIVDGWSLLAHGSTLSSDNYTLWATAINQPSLKNPAKGIAVCVYVPNIQQASLDNRNNIELVSYELGGQYALVTPGNGSWQWNQKDQVSVCLSGDSLQQCTFKFM